MNITIVRVMDKDHSKIKEVLMEFEREENRNFEKSKEIFMRFKWMLEKHFFIEEKAIFNHYISESSEENESLIRILKEHREILDLIEASEENLFDEKKLDLDDLKHYILAHARFEDEVFYPKLDELLNEEKKQEIINRIKDIIIE
jgi:hemerythrin superfamily protein